ncbi:MAG TPA: hypothetical protein VKB19_12035 [Pedobacter sp.]|nr:hypothetical protein [Pedobacter sp.]
MKTATKTRQAPGAKTQFVMVTTELQLNNQEVQKAFDAITKSATELLRKFDVPKYRTWLMVDHTKDEQNTNMVSEYICHFWNITLSANKDGRYYIFIDIDEESLNRLGNGLTNSLLRSAFIATHSNDGTPGIEYSLRVNYSLSNIQNFFYRRVVEGETDTVSIFTEEKVIVN